MTLFEKLSYIRRLGTTQRFHTEKFNGEKETVFHHSASTALILLEVLGEECSRSLLKACLIHDLPEGVTGDIPAPVKWEARGKFDDLESEIYKLFNISYPDLSNHDTALLKAADMLDACFTCLEQRMMGNMLIDGVFDAYVDYNAKHGITTIDFRFQEIWLKLFESYSHLQALYRCVRFHPSRNFFSNREMVNKLTPLELRLARISDQRGFAYPDEDGCCSFCGQEWPDDLPTTELHECSGISRTSTGFTKPSHVWNGYGFTAVPKTDTKVEIRP